MKTLLFLITILLISCDKKPVMVYCTMTTNNIGYFERKNKNIFINLLSKPIFDTICYGHYKIGDSLILNK